MGSMERVRINASDDLYDRFIGSMERIRINASDDLDDRFIPMRILNNLNEFDSIISEILPKMFYHFEVNNIPECFIVVPSEFKEQVEKKMEYLVVLSINLNMLYGLRGEESVV